MFGTILNNSIPATQIPADDFLSRNAKLGRIGTVDVNNGAFFVNDNYGVVQRLQNGSQMFF